MKPNLFFLRNNLHNELFISNRYDKILYMQFLYNLLQASNYLLIQCMHLENKIIILLYLLM